MAKAPPPRAPRTDPAGSRHSRRGWWVAAALGAVLVLAWAWFGSGGGETAAPAPAPAVAPGSLGARERTATEVSDPAEQRRLSELEERRGRYLSLRNAFGAGSPPSPPALSRLSSALSALWPAGSVPWRGACSGMLCRVDGPAPASAWHEQLSTDPGVKAIAERVVVDPDGVATAAFLVLLPAGASSSASVLDAVEEDFRTSTEIRQCLSRIGATGSVDFTITLDSSGYSYRQSSDLPLEALDCAGGVLGEILDRHPPTQPVQTGTRTLTLRR